MVSKLLFTAYLSLRKDDESSENKYYEVEISL